MGRRPRRTNEASMGGLQLQRGVGAKGGMETFLFSKASVASRPLRKSGERGAMKSSSSSTSMAVPADSSSSSRGPSSPPPVAKDRAGGGPADQRWVWTLLEIINLFPSKKVNFLTGYYPPPPRRPPPPSTPPRCGRTWWHTSLSDSTWQNVSQRVEISNCLSYMT